MTGSLTYTLPIITSIIVSKIIGDYCIESIYDKLLAPFPYFDSRLTNLKNASVSDILEKTLTLEMARRYSIQELEMYSEKLSNDQGFAILQDGNLAGFISKNELTHALNQTRELKQTQFSCFFKRKRRNEIWDPLNSPVIESNEPNDYSKWIDQAPLMVSIHCSIDLVIELFVKMGAKTVLVVDDGRFMGVVYKKRLVTWLKEA